MAVCNEFKQKIAKCAKSNKIALIDLYGLLSNRALIEY